MNPVGVTTFESKSLKFNGLLFLFQNICTTIVAPKILTYFPFRDDFNPRSKIIAVQ